jgi:hypothetical protein
MKTYREVKVSEINPDSGWYKTESKVYGLRYFRYDSDYNEWFDKDDIIVSDNLDKDGVWLEEIKEPPVQSVEELREEFEFILDQLHKEANNLPKNKSDLLQVGKVQSYTHSYMVLKSLYDKLFESRLLSQPSEPCKHLYEKLKNHLICKKCGSFGEVDHTVFEQPNPQPTEPDELGIDHEIFKKEEDQKEPQKEGEALANDIIKGLSSLRSM